MLTTITVAILDGNVYDIAKFVQAALDAGNDPQAVLKAMTSGLDQLGSKFEKGEVFLPELMISGEAFTEGMEVLEPLLAQNSMGQAGKIVIGTVKGDMHDIGKNLVVFLLKSAGFEVIDLGIDISTEGFVNAVKEHKPDVLGMSALLSTTMIGMEGVIKALDQKGLRSNTKVIIGGGPVSESYAKSIGADAYAYDAVTGVKRIKDLI